MTSNGESATGPDPREVVAVALARHSQPTARAEHIGRLAAMPHRLNLAEHIVAALNEAGCLGGRTG